MMKADSAISRACHRFLRSFGGGIRRELVPHRWHSSSPNTPLAADHSNWQEAGQHEWQVKEAVRLLHKDVKEYQLRAKNNLVTSQVLFTWGGRWRKAKPKGWKFDENVPPGEAMSPQERRELLYAMLTTLVFDPSEAALAAVDEVLAQERRDNQAQVVRWQDAAKFSGDDSRLGVWQGDITRLEIDSIVNAANNFLLGCNLVNHKCIDNIIHAEAGPRLRKACRAVMQRRGGELEATGEAVATPAFQLPCKLVLHTVGPIVNLTPGRTADMVALGRHPDTLSGCQGRESGAVSPKHENELRRCYSRCLEEAARLGASSVAFPCISTGVFGYPRLAAAAVALDSVGSTLDRLEEQQGAKLSVVFNTFTQEDTDIYERLLNVRSG